MFTLRKSLKLCITCDIRSTAESNRVDLESTGRKVLPMFLHTGHL